MKKAIVAAFTGLFLAAAVAASAAESKMMKKETSKGKTYEVVDVACYLKEGKGATGEKHKACAAKCINGGGELALLRDKKLYIPVDKDFKSARNQFTSKAGDKVEVMGKVMSKGGVNYLQIEQ